MQKLLTLLVLILAVSVATDGIAKDSQTAVGPTEVYGTLQPSFFNPFDLDLTSVSSRPSSRFFRVPRVYPGKGALSPFSFSKTPVATPAGDSTAAVADTPTPLSSDGGAGASNSTSSRPSRNGDGGSGSGVRPPYRPSPRSPFRPPPPPLP